MATQAEHRQGPLTQPGAGAESGVVWAPACPPRAPSGRDDPTPGAPGAGGLRWAAGNAAKAPHIGRHRPRRGHFPARSCGVPYALFVRNHNPVSACAPGLRPRPNGVCAGPRCQSPCNPLSLESSMPHMSKGAASGIRPGLLGAPVSHSEGPGFRSELPSLLQVRLRAGGCAVGGPGVCASFRRSRRVGN